MIVLSAAMVFTMGFGLTACGGGSDAGEKDTLNIVDGEWYGIDTLQLDSSAGCQQLVGESLFERDPETGNLSDGVCTNWKVSDDLKSITFDVPEGMYYSTGEQVEPEDVVASLQHGLDVSPYKDAYENITDMSVDGRTVTMQISSYACDMEYNFTSDFICIIDKDELDSMSDDELLWGSHPYGMYYLADPADYVSGSEIKLTRNDKFVTHDKNVENTGMAPFQFLDLTFNVEEYTAIESLKAGDVDMIGSISADSRSQLEGDATIVVEEGTYPETNYAEVNTNYGIFQDKNLRLAFSKLIDRDALIELTDGSAYAVYTPISDLMQDFSQEAKDDYIANYANDVEGGLKLLEEAGWTEKNAEGYLTKDGKVLEIGYYTSDANVSKIIGEGLQAQMKQYGIKVNFEAIDWNYVHEKVEGDKYDIGRECLSWAEPILIFNCMYYDPTAPSATDEYYDKVKEIQGTPEPEKRVELITALEKEIAENVDLIPMWGEKGFFAHNAQLQGFKVDSQGGYPFQDLKWVPAE